MHQSPVVCRICLSVDALVTNIDGTALQLVYERLTGALLVSGNRPVAACYICHAMLKKSHKLMVTAIRADHVLTNILEKTDEITEKSISLIDREAIGLCASLSFSVAECDDSTPPARVTVKTEPESEDAGDTATDDEVPGDGAAEGQQPVAGSSRNSYYGEPQSADTRHQCHVCLREFQKKSTLQRHIRTHTGEKPYKCNNCGKQFNRNDSLILHLRTHTGEKPFECKLCCRRFADNSAIQRHLRSHSGEKPYKCNNCGKQFNQKGTLETHFRTHTGEKPFECEVCRRRFAHSCTLKTHLRTHTGEKPYKCKNCGKQFNQRGHLETHLRTHTDENKMFLIK